MTTGQLTCNRDQFNKTFTRVIYKCELPHFLPNLPFSTVFRPVTMGIAKKKEI